MIAEGLTPEETEELQEIIGDDSQNPVIVTRVEGDVFEISKTRGVSIRRDSFYNIRAWLQRRYPEH